MASSIDAITSGAGGVITTADNTGILQLKTAGTTAVTVDASQNVGIGTTSPANYGAGYKTVFLNGSTSGVLDIGTNGTRVLSSYYDSSTTAPWITSITAVPLVFGTNGVERMRIDSSGNLIVNGSSTISGYRFTLYHTDSNGMAYKYNGTSEANSCSFQNGNGQVGRIYTSNSNTTYSTSSDYRLKENVVPMTGALDKVAQLNPVTFTWKVDGTDGQGFIAHELQEVVPDCVGGTKDAVDAEGNPVYQDVDTSFLVATLTKAIQEQQELIKQLQADVAELKGAK